MHSVLIKKLRFSLSARLALWVGGFFSIGVLLIFSILFFYLRHSLIARDRAVISQEVTEYASAIEMEGPDEVVRRIKNEGHTASGGDVFLIRILNPNGSELLNVSPSIIANYDLSQLSSGNLADAAGWKSISETKGGGHILDVFGVVIRGGYVVQIGMTSDERDIFLQDYRTIFLKVAILALVISIIGGALVARSAMQPIEKLGATLAEIQVSGDFSKRSSLDSTRPYSEIKKLAFVFDSLMGRIEQLIEGMRTGLDTAAHEIKSPLTRLRINAESALFADDPKDQKEGLHAIVEETDRLTQMIDLILDLTEANAQAAELRKIPTSVQKILNSVFELYEDVAKERNLLLKVIPNAVHIQILVDRDRLIRAIANVVDNALKFTPAGGEVFMEVAEIKSVAQIIVKDNGLGIPANELPQIWDRMFRGSLVRDFPGYGLGLPLVKAIIQAQNGTVNVESVLGSGTVFKFTFPVVQDL